MQIEFDILRMDGQERKPYRQSILCEMEDADASVATALRKINTDVETRDIHGNPVPAIRWECSCLQKRCGACAMRINGKPRLACDAKLKEFANKTITLEPLKKFPVVADLVVDRSILYENLKLIGAWLEERAELESEDQEMAYEGSRCLQCGCCLEVCPNFYAGGDFMGMAAFVPTARLMSELSATQRQKIFEAYRSHIYEGCGKSLACRNICPAGIEIEKLMIRSNAMAIWKRRKR
ncbi:MAG: 4Fe-4S dicluster domain-containing protein [Lachnospiraceae bacterium]|nr:4Fe-4S dicluster domain-containing protein [Lachnospiraceae bacterium]